MKIKKILVLTAAITGLFLQSTTAQVTKYSKPAELHLQDTYVPIDYDLQRQAIEAKQQQYEQQREYEKQKAQAQMQQVHSYYSSFTKYPEKVSDGWHNAVAMNNLDFCAERKVFVVDNKITRYFVDDRTERQVTFSGLINQCKGLIQLKFDDGSTEFLDVYFLDELSKN